MKHYSASQLTQSISQLALPPSQEDLAREGRIKMTVGKQGDLISLIYR
jgi:hypothetical protein